MADSTDRRILLVIRHARARHGGALDDWSRQLAESGASDARTMGAWLRDQGLVPDHVWTSTATRAQDTVVGLLAGAAAAPAVVAVDDMYCAPWADLLAVARETPDTASLVALVAHSPGVGRLALGLDDGTAGMDLVDTAAFFPPGSVAVLEVPSSTRWAELGPGTAALVRMAVPRGRTVEVVDA